MSNLTDITGLRLGVVNSYDSWRLKGLTEERADQAQAQLDEHIRAMAEVKSRLGNGDLAGAAEALKQVQARLGSTAASISPRNEENGKLDVQLVKLSRLAVNHGLYEADNWLGRRIAKRAGKK